MIGFKELPEQHEAEAVVLESKARWADFWLF
jgi:hypothetical protein